MSEGEDTPQKKLNIILQLIRENVMTSPGGLVAPIVAPYELLTTTRPVRELFVEQMKRMVERANLPPEDRIAFDLDYRGYAVIGRVIIPSTAVVR